MNIFYDPITNMVKLELPTDTDTVYIVQWDNPYEFEKFAQWVDRKSASFIAHQEVKYGHYHVRSEQLLREVFKNGTGS